MGTWTEGIIDENDDHIKLWFKENINPTAMVATQKKQLIVQFLDLQDQEAINAVVKDLDFYFIELGKEDPWEYAIYHTTTASNVYSDVHWGYFPKGYLES